MNIIHGKTEEHNKYQLERIKNRRFENDIMYSIGDVLIYLLHDKGVENLFDIMPKNIDLLLNLRKDTCGTKIVYNVIKLSYQNCDNYPRRQFIRTISKLFMNYITSINFNSHFQIHIYLRNTNMTPECCICFEEYPHLKNYVIVCPICKNVIHESCIPNPLKCPTCKFTGKLIDIRESLKLPI